MINLREPTAPSRLDKRVRRLRRRARTRRRILQSTALLPSLCTISNGLSGFAAIHFATKDGLGSASLFNLGVAAWCIFAAMVFDMLDGRLARMTRNTTDFGGQLDSLCDIISFGVAPAALMLHTVVMAMRTGEMELFAFLPGGLAVERLIWCVAGLYLACGTLRLARFNVENVPDESSHRYFRGLPTPGAAAPIAALVLLLDHFHQIQAGWRSSPWLPAAVALTLPLVMLAGALLMVSRVRYSHVVNQYIRGRRPFSYLVKIVAIGLAALLEPYSALAVVTVGYALSGLAGAAWRLAFRRQPPPPSPTLSVEP
jgi:CDP-diacylglycerol--serine O-phosphatidyltransferase